MFSEKYGYKQEKKIQIKSITKELRNRIWNLFYQCELKPYEVDENFLDDFLSGNPTIEEKIVDKLGFSINSVTPPKTRLRTYIEQSAKWYEVYDVVEIYISFLEEKEREQRTKQLNTIFEQEKSGYRIVLGEVTPITNDAEIETIEQAAATPYDSVNQHISKALAHYADLKNPDYENSVKEAISAVEAMCCVITGTSGRQATLGKAIKKLEESGIHIHGAMEKGFESLYGYASDENGIRHGGKDFKSVPPEDAKFMLISCSAFVNYLNEKWSKVENN